MKEGIKKIINKIRSMSENILDFLVKKESTSLRTILEDHADNKREFSVSEKNMLTNIIGFGESRVEDSMVPRADIIAVDVNISAQEVIKLFSECNHSRIALYRSTLDDPVGMLHIKDFVRALSEVDIDDIIIEKLVKDIIFVPPSMKSRELLLKMQVSRIHMALVIDEYGGTDGLLTIENLIETGVEENNYLKYLTFNDLIKWEKGMRGEQDRKTALTTLYRHNDAIMGLVGGKCSKTGTIQYPASPISVSPNSPELNTQEPYKFAEKKAKILSWSADYLSFSINPPNHYGVVDFEGGGRIMIDFTDIEKGEIDSGMEVKMVFRVKIVDDIRGFTRYFWKAIPV